MITETISKIAVQLLDSTGYAGAAGLMALESMIAPVPSEDRLSQAQARFEIDAERPKFERCEPGEMLMKQIEVDGPVLFPLIAVPGRPFLNALRLKCSIPGEVDQYWHAL